MFNLIAFWGIIFIIYFEKIGRNQLPIDKRKFVKVGIISGNLNQSVILVILEHISMAWHFNFQNVYSKS